MRARVATNPVLLVGLLACHATSASYSKPVLDVDPYSVLFGTLAPGESGTQTVTLRNDTGTSAAAGLSLGIGSIELVDTTGAFQVSWDAQAVSEPKPPPHGSGRYDTGNVFIPDSAPTWCGDTAGDTAPPCVVDTGGPAKEAGFDVAAAVIPPGGSLPLSVTVTMPVAGSLDPAGDVDAALLIHTVSQSEPAAKASWPGLWYADPVHLDRIIYLLASSSRPDVTGVGVTVVGGMTGLDAGQHACEQGDVITFSVLARDAGGESVTYAWQDDLSGSAGFDSRNAQVVHFTCPADPNGEGTADLIVVSVGDQDGFSVTGSAKIGVYPSGSGLYSPLAITSR